MRDFIKRNCHSRLLRPIAGLGRSVNRYYENRNYQSQSNGEERVLKILSQFSCDTVFDVGANIGSWTVIASRFLPRAKFYCFEPVPSTYESLEKTVQGLPNAKAFNLALGGESGSIPFFHYEDGSELSSAYRFQLHKEVPKEIIVKMTNGDAFVAENEISSIDFLKIDVEGHDLEVLRGFGETLKKRKIKAIQFEYGRINIVSRSLLRDFYQFLHPLGFRIGKIYPKEVEFKDYQFEQEDFLGPNFLAVSESETGLISALGKTSH